jgi:hypothetical protein
MVVGMGGSFSRRYEAMGESIACSDESATQACADSPSEQESRQLAHALSVGPRPNPAPRARNAAGLIDWSTAVVDGSHMRALQGGLDRALAA